MCMRQLKKLFLKMKNKDQVRVLRAVDGILDGSLRGSRIIGSYVHKYRVGDYRILYFSIDEKNHIYDIRRRNEKTYKKK